MKIVVAWAQESQIWCKTAFTESVARDGNTEDSESWINFYLSKDYEEISDATWQTRNENKPSRSYNVIYVDSQRF